MSFNDNYSEKLDEFRTQLVVSLQPQPYLDEFRSKGVMTVQDSEKIMNKYRHSNTASQIGEMLDILKTKGPRGYSIFINVLGTHNPDIYTDMTGKEAPEQPIPLSCTCNCNNCLGSGNITNLEQLTEAVKRKEKLEAEMQNLKVLNSKLASHNKEYSDKLNRLWKRLKVEKEKNNDRDRLEAERNEMMEQLTAVTGKALSYKEQLEVSTNNLHQSRLEHLRMKRELEKANRGLKQQRQKSMQIERSYSHSRTLIKNTEELQEKVTRLELELCKADKGESNRASLIQPSSESESTVPISESEKDSRLIQLQTDLEIMRNDRDEALSKAEEAVSQMYKVTKELHEVEEKLEKLAQEKDDLLLNLETQKDEADMQKRFVLLAEDQLTRAVEERNHALEEKTVQTTKCARLMLQRDALIEQQRTLRAEMTNLKEKQLAAEAKMIKYKTKLRKKSGRHRDVDLNGRGDDDDYDSSSSGSMDFNAQLDINPDGADVEPKDEESDQSATKRDSSTSGTSTNDPTMPLSEESEDDLGPSSQFRARAQPLPSKYKDRPAKVSDFPLDEFPTGESQSAGASTDEDGYTSGVFSSRATSDSTKVQADRESLYRNQLRLGFGSISHHAGTKRVKRREKKPSPNSQLNRRSKSFNDLSSMSLEEELDLDLDLDIAFKQESERYSPIIARSYKSRGIDKNMNFKQDFERSDGGLADIDSSGEIHIESLQMRRPRKLSHGMVLINKLVEVGKNVWHEPNFIRRPKEDMT